MSALPVIQSPARAQGSAPPARPSHASGTLGQASGPPNSLGPSVARRASALLDTVRSNLRGPLTLQQVQAAERARARLDELPDAADAYKVAAHDALGTLFRAIDLDTAITFHSQAVIALAPYLDSADRKRLAHPLIHAYRNLAEVVAGHGHAEAALDLLRGAPAALPDVPDVAHDLATEIARYEMIGKPALSITAPRWISAPANTKTIDPGTGGAVTVVELTAWWCAACTRSYPALKKVQQHYGAEKVHVLLATSLMGRFRADTNLAPEVEFAKLRDYYANENALSCPVAVADSASDSSGLDANAARYHVYAIPEVAVVDARGIVHRILVGWDPGNDDRLDQAVGQALAGNASQ